MGTYCSFTQEASSAALKARENGYLDAQTTPATTGKAYTLHSKAYALPSAAVATGTLLRTLKDKAMRQTKLETTDPAQWLRLLSQERDGFRRLVRESKGNASAAYRIARARCNGDSPLLEDLQSAMSLLAARLGGQSELPIRSLLPTSISGVMPVARPVSIAPVSAQTARPQEKSLAPPAQAEPFRPDATRASA